MSSVLNRAAVFAFTLLAGAAAQAATVNLRLDDFTIPGPSEVDVSVVTPASASYEGAAGQFIGTLDGKSFKTYCVDLLQPFEFDTNYTYTLLDGAAAWGAAKAQDLGRLLTYVESPRWSTESAVVQAAVWEILYETEGRYSFSSGNIQTDGESRDMDEWLDSLDWTKVMATSSKFDVDLLQNDRTQDFLLANPVPEPSTYALLAAGLGAISFVARRRRVVPV